MKKCLTLALALVLMCAFSVSVMANVSPEGGVITTTTGGAGDQGGLTTVPGEPGATTQPSGSNDSPTAPQTGTVYVLLVGAVAVASIGAAAVVSKSLAKR